MLLYSTILKVKSTVTKEDFIKLVIKWNQDSPHSSNIISNIEWNGERNIRYGNEELWLDIEEYRNKNTIAVRYEKKEKDGAIWDTDYIMNFDEMRISIQLDRSYTEDAMMEDLKFSTPHFVSMLIDEGYLEEDNGISVLNSPIIIDDKNTEVLTDVINGVAKYRLPVVYISKTMYNHDPVNVRMLCSKLKGVAHVFLEDDWYLNSKIRKDCNDNNEYFGGVGIYFPNANHRRFLYRSYPGSESVLAEKVSRSVFQYMNAQQIPILYTWQGVSNLLLTDQLNNQKTEKAEAERARKEAEREVNAYLGAFDEDNERLRKQIEELTRANNSLQQEVQGLRAKLNNQENIPVLYLGNEEEFYPGEIREFLLDEVNEALKKYPKKTRRTDVFEDILENNAYKNISIDRKNTVKNMFKDYKSLSAAMRQGLSDMGFEIREDGKHYRLTYYGDNRYHTTIAKTGSDHREGRNIAANIIKVML